MPSHPPLAVMLHPAPNRHNVSKHSACKHLRASRAIGDTRHISKVLFSSSQVQAASTWRIMGIIVEDYETICHDTMYGVWNVATSLVERGIEWIPTCQLALTRRQLTHSLCATGTSCLLGSQLAS